MEKFTFTPYEEFGDSLHFEEPAVAYIAGTSGISLQHFFEKYVQMVKSTAMELRDLAVVGSFLELLQKATQIKAEIMADIIGVSKSKYYRLLKAETLDSNAIDALASFTKLWHYGLLVFDKDLISFKAWLNTRNENMGGIMPLQLLQSENGRREVEKALDRIEYSVYG